MPARCLGCGRRRRAPVAEVTAPGAAPPEQVRYPQLLQTRDSRWWRPVLGLLLAGFTLAGASVVVILGAFAAAALTGGTAGLESRDSLDPDTALGLLANNLVLAALVPASVVAVLAVHRTPPGFLASVTGRVRWEVLLRLLAVALGAVVVFFAVGFLVPVGESSDADPTRPGTGALVGLLAVILLTTPLQAAAEEVGFRGYLSQAVASWSSRPYVGAAVAAVVSAGLFALAHGVQDSWLFADRLAFGLVASWLVWRTGGLEAPVALHVANNLVSLVYSAAVGDLEAALTASTLPWQLALLDIAMMLSYAAAAAVLVRRWGVAVTRPAPGVLSAPTQVGYPGPGPSTPPPAGSEHPWGMG